MKMIFLSTVILLSCSGRPAETWQPLYQNDLNGQSLFGNKADLLKAVADGKPVRVSWGQRLDDGTSCIEFAEPHFITLNDRQELVIQLPESLIQTSYTKAGESYLNTKSPSTWHALMSTDGHYHQFHSDFGTRQITKVMYLRAKITWFVPANAEWNSNMALKPVLDHPDGIVLDSIVNK